MPATRPQLRRVFPEARQHQEWFSFLFDNDFEQQYGLFMSFDGPKVPLSIIC